MLTEHFKVYKVDDVIPKEAYLREGTVIESAVKPRPLALGIYGASAEFT